MTGAMLVSFFAEVQTTSNNRSLISVAEYARDQHQLTPSKLPLVEDNKMALGPVDIS